MTQNYIKVEGGEVRSIVGPKAVDVYAMHILASALRLYAKTGMKANRAYSPKAMLQAAERWTGQKFKGRDKYNEAAKAVALAADDYQRQHVEVRRG